MESYVSLVGYIAATLTTISFIPQVIQVWKTQSAKDVSLGMYSFFSLGVAMWLFYGVMLGAWPIIIANSITLILASAVLIMKIKFK